MEIIYSNNLQEAKEFVCALDGNVIGVDTETFTRGIGDAADPYQAQCRLIQLFDNKKSIVLDLAFIGMFEELKQLLTDPMKVKVAHNGKFEFKQIYMQYGIKMTNLFCTMIGGQVTDNGIYKTFNLEDMSYRDLGWVLDKRHQKHNWGFPLYPDHIEYAGIDPAATYYLYFKQIKKAKELDLLGVLDLEMSLLPCVARMELNGVYYSQDGLKKLGDDLQTEFKTLLREAQSQLPKVELPAGFFTPTGGLTKKARDLGYLDGRRPPETRDDFIKAYRQIGVEIPKMRDKQTHQWKESLSKETYGKIQHPTGKILQRWNSIKTLYNTFVKAALPDGKDNGWFNPITGRVHPGINQCGTVTGRFSMSNPNFQNIPRKESRFRKLLYAPEGYTIVKADYSQIEMRVMAQVSGDSNLIQAYVEDKDVHIITAGQIYNRDIEAYQGYESNKILKEERQLGKNVNFGSLYGQMAIGLQQYLFREAGVEYSLDDCEKFLSAFFTAFPGIKEYHRNMKKYVIDSVLKNTVTGEESIGRVEVRTLCNRLRIWPDVKVTQRIGKYGPYFSAQVNEELNHPIQGTVGDVMKRVMVQMDRDYCQKDPDILIILQVHDELVFLVKDEKVEHYSKVIESVMIYQMEQVVNVVPIKVDVTTGFNWAGDKRIA